MKNNIHKIILLRKKQMLHGSNSALEMQKSNQTTNKTGNMAPKIGDNSLRKHGQLTEE